MKGWKDSPPKELEFGDILGNGWAKSDNPHKVGVFVRSKKNTLELTDLKGKFWEQSIHGSKLIKLGTLDGPYTYNEWLQKFQGCEDSSVLEKDANENDSHI